MATSTYSGDPSNSETDSIRFILSDTKEPWKFSNEEIQYTLDREGNPYAAAADLAMIMSGRYTDRRDKTVGPLSIKYGEIGDRWEKLATSIRKRASRSTGARVIMTQSSRQHYFTLGQHDMFQFHKESENLLGDVQLPAEDSDFEFPDTLDGGGV